MKQGGTTMQPLLLSKNTEIDANVNFKYRTVYIHAENSRLHYHDYYEIFLTLANGVIHHINGQTQLLPQGTLSFIRKSDTHYFETAVSTEKAPSFINLAFTEDILNALFSFLTEGYPSRELLTQPDPPSILLHDVDINWCVKQLETLNAISASDIPQLKYHSRILLFKIFTRFFSKITFDSPDSNVPDWLQKLNREMCKLENFSRNSDHMVQMSGKCRAYLGRMLKQHYNKTISQYINDLRLNYWANSLANSDAPILDICFECGFENVSWAYTLFKEKYGMSPLKYRTTAK